MPINPDLIEIKKVTELPDLALAITNYFAHCKPDGVLGKATMQALAAFIAPYVATLGSSPYIETTGTVLSNPTTLTTAMTFVGGPLTFTQTTGGSIATVQPLNLLSWNGTTWSLTLAIPIDLTLYLQKSEAKQNYIDLLSLDLDIPIPSDKSGVTFNTANLNPLGFYFQTSTLISVGTTLKKIFVKAETAGSVRIGLLTVSGSTATVAFSTTHAVNIGVNEIDADTLQIPEGIYASPVYIAITAVTSGVLKYLTDVGGDGNVTANLSGGAITPAAVSFPYWIAKNYELDTYPETKQGLEDLSNMVGVPESNIVPYDKSSIVPNGNGLTTIWLGTDLAWFGSSRPLESITFISRTIANDIRISFVEITGTTANIIYTSPAIDVTTTGVVTIPLSSLTGVPSDINTAYSRLQVFMSNETFTGSSSFGYLQVASGLGEKYYSITKATGVLTTSQQSTSVVILGYWINVIGIVYPPIIQEIKNLQAADLTVSTYDELVTALATNDVITMSSGEFIFTSTITITSTKTIIGNKNTVIKLGSGVTKAFYLNEAHNSIIRDITIDGGSTQLDTLGTSILPNAVGLETLVGNGTKVGLHIYHSQGVSLENISIINFNSFGYFLENVGDDGTGTYRFKTGVNLSNCIAENCYMGFRFGNGAQYSRLSNSKSIHCINGISVTAGNVTSVNGQFDNNRVGIHVGAGSNNAHGSFLGGTANHNSLRGVYVANITNGHVFSGVNLFDGHIEVYNSIGVLFSGCLIASEITATLNTDQGMQIVGSIWRSDGGYNTGVINKTGVGKLFLDTNRYTSGKSDTGINGVL